MGIPSSPVLELLAFTAQGLDSVLVGELRLHNPCSVGHKKIFVLASAKCFFSTFIDFLLCDRHSRYGNRVPELILKAGFLNASRLLFFYQVALVTSHKFLPGGIKLSLIMNSLKFQIFYLNTLLWKFLNICKGSKIGQMNPMFPLFKLQQLATFCDLISFVLSTFHFSSVLKANHTHDIILSLNTSVWT